jgi:hypothetical protein
LRFCPDKSFSNLNRKKAQGAVRWHLLHHLIMDALRIARKAVWVLLF